MQAFIPNSLASKTSSDLVRASFRFQMKQDIPDRKQTIEFFDRRLKNRYFGIRHGQSEANVQEIISSDPQTASSYPLTECGRNQAEGILEHHIPKLWFSRMKFHKFQWFAKSLGVNPAYFLHNHSAAAANTLIATVGSKDLKAWANYSPDCTPSTSVLGTTWLKTDSSLHWLPFSRFICD